jgi:hypothetical protein
MHEPGWKLRRFAVKILFSAQPAGGQGRDRGWVDRWTAGRAVRGERERTRAGAHMKGPRGTKLGPAGKHNEDDESNREDKKRGGIWSV